MERQTIYFYDRVSDRVKAEDIYLNNFEITPITVNGLEFQSVEHFYQASKFAGAEFENVRLAATPDHCKKLARTLEHNEIEWEARKDSVMMQGLLCKFEQHPCLLEKLLSTGNAKLIEDSDRDPYWGGALPGSKNRLGQMLEEIRDNYLKNN